MPDLLKAFWQLGKPGISVAVSLSALTAFLLSAQGFEAGWLPLVCGIFSLSFAASALNQIQEQHHDSLMNRTKGRPLPSGQVSQTQTWFLVALGSLAGSFLLWLAGGIAAMLLGLINMLIYNGIYTPLKTKTLFAMLPGSLVGAVPPLIGWISAGGPPLHTHIVLLAMFFFIGQIPHTWLILIRYDAEYKQAGFPNLSGFFSLNQAVRLSFIWVVATALSIVLFSVFGLFKHGTSSAGSMAVAFVMVIWYAGRVMEKNPERKIKHGFILLNAAYLAMMLLIMADSLIT